MKKTITAVLAVLLLHVTAFSFNRNAKPAEAKVTREVELAGKFQNVSVNNNVQLVLVPGYQKNTVTIVGPGNLVNDVNVTFSKNEMRISSKRSLKQGRITVYVPAKDITYVNLNGGSSVAAQGYLESNDLTVLVNVGSSVNLASLGNINIQGADDCDIQFEKNEKTKVITIAK